MPFYGCIVWSSPDEDVLLECRHLLRLEFLRRASGSASLTAASAYIILFPSDRMVMERQSELLVTAVARKATVETILMLGARSPGLKQ